MKRREREGNGMNSDARSPPKKRRRKKKKRVGDGEGRTTEMN